MLKDEMLTIQDLAAYLRLQPQTIYKWAQAGKIPGAKFGKEWRFRKSAIERWIDSRIPGPKPGLASGDVRPAILDGKAGDGASLPEGSAAPPQVRSPPVNGKGARKKRARTRRTRGADGN